MESEWRLFFCEDDGLYTNWQPGLLYLTLFLHWEVYPKEETTGTDRGGFTVTVTG